MSFLTGPLLAVAGWLFQKFIGIGSSGLLQSIAKSLGGDPNSQVAIESIKAEVASRQAARDIRLATASFWEMRLLTALTLFFMVSNVGLVWFDTVTTGTRFEIMDWKVAALPAPIHEWQGAIILSLFGLYGALKTADSIMALAAKWLQGKLK